MQLRSRDPQIRIYPLAREDIHVVCPRCHQRAVSRQLSAEANVLFAPRRLTCTNCGHSAAWEKSSSYWGGPIDPHFRLPLWLRADFRGHTLWAFNEAHLDFLEQHVQAHLRERTPGGMTMVARLPKWMKSAKNREGVLRAIRKLRATL